MNMEKALRLPMEKDGLVRVVIGAVLNIIPIVNFLCAGYLIDVMKSAIKEQPEMPVWEAWGDKFIKGLVVFVISLVYMLIPIIIITIGGGIGSIFGRGFSLMFLLALLIGLICWFMLPMAIACYATAGNLSAAFNFGAIITYIRAGLSAYLSAYLLSVILMVALIIISLIPVLGWIVCVFGGFYMSCVLSLLFGEAYRKASQTIGVDKGVSI